ncbi:TPA: DUF4113 domain-containing protein [Pseudomonas aeruginosa]
MEGWSMRRELLTAAYTTKWRVLAKAECQAFNH